MPDWLFIIIKRISTSALVEIYGICLGNRDYCASLHVGMQRRWTYLHVVHWRKCSEKCQLGIPTFDNNKQGCFGQGVLSRLVLFHWASPKFASYTVFSFAVLGLQTITFTLNDSIYRQFTKWFMIDNPVRYPMRLMQQFQHSTLSSYNKIFRLPMPDENRNLFLHIEVKCFFTKWFYLFAPVYSRNFNWKS